MNFFRCNSFFTDCQREDSQWKYLWYLTAATKHKNQDHNHYLWGGWHYRSSNISADDKGSWTKFSAWFLSKISKTNFKRIIFTSNYLSSSVFQWQILAVHYVGVAEGWDVELKQTLDERRHRRHIITSLITSTQSSKIPLQTLSLPLYVNAGLVWKDRVLFLFPWLLVLSLVLIKQTLPQEMETARIQRMNRSMKFLSESQLQMTVGPVTIVPVYDTHFINYR